MAHTYTDLLIHVVFSTKEHAPMLTPAIRDKLFPYMNGIASNLKCKVCIFGGTTDHVHGLVGLSREVSVSQFLRVLKANSSKWAGEQYPSTRFAWQVGYGAFAVSRSKMQDVYQYIARQEQHHKKMTFKEEFTALLQKHGMKPDEYSWR
jgi:REP element-mobilizing transposase RayT